MPGPARRGPVRGGIFRLTAPTCSDVRSRGSSAHRAGPNCGLEATRSAPPAAARPSSAAVSAKAPPRAAVRRVPGRRTPCGTRPPPSVASGASLSAAGGAELTWADDDDAPALNLARLQRLLDERRHSNTTAGSSATVARLTTTGLQALAAAALRGEPRRRALNLKTKRFLPPELDVGGSPAVPSRASGRPLADAAAGHGRENPELIEARRSCCRRFPELPFRPASAGHASANSGGAAAASAQVAALQRRRGVWLARRRRVRSSQVATEEELVEVMRRHNNGCPRL